MLYLPDLHEDHIPNISMVRIVPRPMIPLHPEFSALPSATLQQPLLRRIVLSFHLNLLADPGRICGGFLGEFDSFLMPCSYRRTDSKTALLWPLKTLIKYYDTIIVEILLPIDGTSYRFQTNLQDASKGPVGIFQPSAKHMWLVIVCHQSKEKGLSPMDPNTV